MFGLVLELLKFVIKGKERFFLSCLRKSFKMFKWNIMSINKIGSSKIKLYLLLRIIKYLLFVL